MLKVPHEDEERRGGAVMRWWNGGGAATVLELDPETGAILLDRAMGGGDLARMAQAGRDDAATSILCTTLARLHVPRPEPFPELVPLSQWFDGLMQVGAGGGFFADAAAVAGTLLRSQRDIRVLHGDLHHGNVLDFGPQGWLAIDPKGLVGDRTFDYVNMLRNPDPTIAPTPERFSRQASRIAELAGLERRRLLLWTYAFTALSAVWTQEEGGPEHLADRDVMELAASELRR